MYKYILFLFVAVTHLTVFCFSAEDTEIIVAASVKNLRLADETYRASEDELADIIIWNDQIEKVKQFCRAEQYDQIEIDANLLQKAGRLGYLAFLENFVQSLLPIPRYVCDAERIVELMLVAHGIIVPGLTEYIDQAHQKFHEDFKEGKVKKEYFCGSLPFYMFPNT
jgi:hypothetical protein